MIELNRATALAFGSLVFTIVLSFVRLVDERWAARMRLVTMLVGATSFAAAAWWLHTRGITVTGPGGDEVTVRLPMAFVLIAMLPWVLTDRVDGPSGDTSGPISITPPAH